jgi:thiamine-monophosphate kinase
MLEETGSTLTPIGKIGEFGLISRITAGFTPIHKSTLKGPGDDAAVVDLGNGKVQIVTTDLLCEGIHFDLAYVPLRHLGYKSVAVNVSDICAMNATAESITVSIAMSNRFTVEAVEELYEGVRLACEHYKVDLLGGDTSSCRTGLVISVTAIGSCKKGEETYRSGAKLTDLICVTGDLGGAYAGLQILEREKKVYLENPSLQPDLAEWDYVVGRQLKPEARVDVIERLRKAGIQPTAMMDLSDGLSGDLHHLCRASGLGAGIYQEKLPIDHQTAAVAELFQIHAVNYALNGGEDYELLFTVPVGQHQQVNAVKDVSVIGYMTDAEEGIRMVATGGQVIPLEPTSWNHFKS